MFAEICKKVYFAIEDYSEVDFTLANGYLSYAFAARAAESGVQDYREYRELCRDNLFGALSRLPLILHASIEAVAALTLGVGAAYWKSTKFLSNDDFRHITQSKTSMPPELGHSFQMPLT